MGIGIFVIILGVGLLAFGYTGISFCLSTSPYAIYRMHNCWNPFDEPYTLSGYNLEEYGIVFYIGVIITIMGAVMLVGADVLRLLSKMREGGPD